MHACLQGVLGAIQNGIANDAFLQGTDVKPALVGYYSRHVKLLRVLLQYVKEGPQKSLYYQYCLPYTGSPLVTNIGLTYDSYLQTEGYNRK